MLYLILRLVVNAVAMLIVANIVQGVSFSSWGILLAAALVVGLLNAVLKPILMLLTLPINVLTFGLFTLFINAFMFYLASELIKGFKVDGFWSAFWGALVFSIVNFVFHLFSKSSKREIQ